MHKAILELNLQNKLDIVNEYGYILDKFDEYFCQPFTKHSVKSLFHRLNDMSQKENR